MSQFRYKVFFTPIESIDLNTYGTEIDVSDRIEIGGIGNIKKSLDSADYDVGLFFFSDITLKGYNKDGYFNESFDSRSIFKNSRDLCKVRVVFSEYVFERDGQLITSDSETSVITFKGIINEEATKLDVTTETITFKVLSLDSILRTTKIEAAIFSNGALASTAIVAILNTPRITTLLNLDELNINPFLDITIDDASKFDNKSVKEKLNQLLIATNSVLYIDDSDNIFVKNRDENTDRPVQLLFGHSDIYGRENILKITEYNTGIHRTFTSFKINETESTDADYAKIYGFRQKAVELDFITDVNTEATIAATLVDGFKIPRIELKVEISTTLAQEFKLLDRVSVNYPLRVKPIDNKFLPVLGASILGDTEIPLPKEYGALSISKNLGFKILEISDNPKDFISTLKLRQIDQTTINSPSSAVLGFAVLGEAILGST